MTDPTTPAEETKAMTKLVTILDGLDPAAQERVVAWLQGRYLGTGRYGREEEAQ